MQQLECQQPLSDFSKRHTPGLAERKGGKSLSHDCIVDLPYSPELSLFQLTSRQVMNNKLLSYLNYSIWVLYTCSQIYIPDIPTDISGESLPSFTDKDKEHLIMTQLGDDRTQFRTQADQVLITHCMSLERVQMDLIWETKLFLLSIHSFFLTYHLFL